MLRPHLDRLPISFDVQCPQLGLRVVCGILNRRRTLYILHVTTQPSTVVIRSAQNHLQGHGSRRIFGTTGLGPDDLETWDPRE